MTGFTASGAGKAAPSYAVLHRPDSAPAGAPNSKPEGATPGRSSYGRANGSRLLPALRPRQAPAGLNPQLPAGKAEADAEQAVQAAA
ncbi:MAG: hypothetical protein GDA41_01325 [Rhodospirillales bacterium]|nr:hypothetical protein [Rhodospirillales bacterium]